MNEVADIIFLALPEPAHPALIAVGLPFAGVDIAIAVERCGELIAVLGAALREVVVAGEFETDSLHGDCGPLPDVGPDLVIAARRPR